MSRAHIITIATIKGEIGEIGDKSRFNCFALLLALDEALATSSVIFEDAPSTLP